MKDIFLTKGSDKAVVSTFGAHIKSWESQGQQRFWMSEAAVLDGSGPIRGGIPICFPVFGIAEGQKLPQHGFARTSVWAVDSVEESSVTLRLTPAEIGASLAALWPYDFVLLCKVSLVAEGQLALSLTIENKSGETCDFFVAFHPYFAVKDISNVSVSGYSAAKVLNKLTNEYYSAIPKSLEFEEMPKQQTRLLENETSKDILISESGSPLLRVSYTNMRDCLVWNPGEAAQGIPDFAPKSGYTTMVCVEPGDIVTPDELPAGKSLTVGFTLSTQ